MRGGDKAFISGYDMTYIKIEIKTRKEEKNRKAEIKNKV